jgi:hypothetical protein
VKNVLYHIRLGCRNFLAEVGRGMVYGAAASKTVRQEIAGLPPRQRWSVAWQRAKEAFRILVRPAR